MTQSFLEGLLAEIQRRFYAAAPARTFHAHRRQLIRAVTWPAVWWRKRGFRTELPPARYRGVLLEVIEGIEGHGAEAKVQPAEMGGSGFFPAYLLKCIQQHYGHNGESLYYSAKPLRDGVAPGGKFEMADCIDIDALVHHAQRFAPVPAGEPGTNTGPRARGNGATLDLEELARAHALISTPKRKPRADTSQTELF